jgi:hypothetical protein
LLSAVEAVLRIRALLLLLGLPAMGVAGLVGGCGISLETPTGGYGGGYATGVAVSSGTGAGTSTGSSGQGGGVTLGGGIAAPCASDADCRTDLKCLQDTFNDPIFGGGPAGGFCTRVCTSDTDCPDPNGTCFKIDPGQSGRCTLGCSIGPAIDNIAGFFAPLDPSKCLGREDLRCKKTGGDMGICFPTCGEDAQCHGGRVCDPRLAVCVDHPNDGLPLGDTCDPTATPDVCGGRCVGFDTGIAMCSSPCVLGGDKIDTADCGGPLHGFCAFRAKSFGPGDTGYCTPACQLQSDCATPSFWCFSVPGLTDVVHRGYCFAAAPCPGGQADCIAAGDNGDYCTDTPYGPLCLDPMFPLTTGTGGAGGAGTGGTGTGGAATGGAGGAGTGGAGTGGAGTGGAGTGGAGTADAGP